MNLTAPDQIDKIIQDNQYKYLELISRSKKYGGYNATPKDLKSKIQQVKKFLENLPDDLYILNFKISPRGDVFPYEYIKGKPILSEAPAAPASIIPIYQNNLEKFQTLDEWKKQEKLIHELQKELELLKFKDQLKSTLSENNQEQPKNNLIGFAETILPNVMPVIDKFFELRERELTIKEKLANKQPAKPLRVIKKQRIEVPQPFAAGWDEYCTMFEALTDIEAANEMKYLKDKQHPAYNELLNLYYDNESQESL
jgi:hypothetical protein